MSNMHAVLPALDCLLRALDDATPEPTEWALGYVAHNGEVPVRRSSSTMAPPGP